MKLEKFAVLHLYGNSQFDLLKHDYDANAAVTLLEKLT